MPVIDLKDFGYDPQFALAAAAAEEHFPARVTEQHKSIYQVITSAGEMPAVISGRMHYDADGLPDYPAVGDWVLVDRLDDQQGQAVIHRILPRRSCLKRKAAGTGGGEQIIAANIDTVFICMALNYDFNLRRLERYLAIVWESGAMPVVVLTKADLCPDLAQKLHQTADAAPGAEIIVTSGLSEDGWQNVRRFIRPGKTIAFVGSSGVGKSTLINKLLGRELLDTQELRSIDKGRHTTTHRQLLLLPDGGMVIDTPGMRELQIAGADLEHSFADIQELALNCAFRDCQHLNEPHCAVKKAVADGELAAERLENFLKMQKEMVFEERKQTMNPAQAEKLKIIGMMGSLKAQKQIVREIKNKKGGRN